MAACLFAMPAHEMVHQIAWPGLPFHTAMLHPKTFWLHRGVFVPPKTEGLPVEASPEGNRPLTIYDVLAWSHPPRCEVVFDERHRRVARRLSAVTRLTVGF